MADELEHHLKERLGEARDFSDFSASRRLAAGTPEGETVTGREVIVEGAEHLSGRKVQDTFTRGGRKPAAVPQAPKKEKLEHHLTERLKEVSDEMLTGRGGTDAALRAYQDLRKKLGGLMIHALLVALMLAALPGEALPQDPLDAAVWSVEDGMGHLLVAAKTGSPLLLQEAEREVLGGLLAGMAATTADGGFVVSSWERVYASYEHASVGFKDLPYRMVVEPGHGQRGFELTLRRHPWLVLMDEPPPGWRVELIESGARLRAE